MDNLDIFAEVVVYKSLNKTAQALKITQPALTRKIKKLEQELGVSLFERKGKRLVLTPAGRISYEFALEMRQLQRKWLNRLSEFTSGLEKKVTIGASLTTLQSTFPDFISMYTKDFPHMDIKAITGKTHEIVSMVKEKKVDMGLVSSQIEQPGLFAVPLFADHLCLVLPNSHPFAKKNRPLQIGELSNLPMILFARESWYRVLMDELFHRYSISPDVKMEIDSFEAIIRLVSTCNAATLLPMSYLRHPLVEKNDVVVRNIPELEQTFRTTTLLFADYPERGIITEDFIEKAKRYFLRSHIHR